jgi:hypothetical protein
MWIMDASGDALFPRRYLDEFEKRISELHRCAELAREYAAEAVHHAAGLLRDAADAHEQAATAYELAGRNVDAGDFQARAMRHRQAAAARRATAASMASRIPDRPDSDDLPLQAAIPDGDPLGLPGELYVGNDHPVWRRGTRGQAHGQSLTARPPAPGLTAITPSGPTRHTEALPPKGQA